MNYLFDKNLSFAAKGLLTLLLHLQEGGVQLNVDTASHYCEDNYNFALYELQQDGYVKGSWNLEAHDNNG